MAANNDMRKKMQDLSEKIRKIKEGVSGEQNTKNFFIVPFLDGLGYDVREPDCIVCEHVADIGKNGEKVDYALKNKDKKIFLLINKTMAKRSRR